MASGFDAVIGLLQCSAAVVLFGSMFVPIKRFTAGDGIFSHWLITIAVLLNGFLICVMEGFPPIYPLAMVGGACWATNNSVAILIIGELGLGLTILLFSITGCLSQFLCGYFGLFGMTPRPPANPVFGFCGLVLIIIGGSMIAFVKNKPSPLKTLDASDYDLTLSDDQWKKPHQLSDVTSVRTLSTGACIIQESECDQTAAKNNALVRIFYIVFALIMGVIGSATAVPTIAMQDHPEIFVGYPQESLPYVFSHHLGGFLQGTLMFICYAVYKKNKPFINPQVCLPSFLGGLLYSYGMIFFFVATKTLSQTVTGPIATMGPGCVASLWSVVYFREIREGKNMWLLCGAICITVLGSIAIGLSN